MSFSILSSPSRWIHLVKRCTLLDMIQVDFLSGSGLIHLLKCSWLLDVIQINFSPFDRLIHPVKLCRFLELLLVLFVSVPHLEHCGAPNIGWEGSSCNRFLTLVHTVYNKCSVTRHFRSCTNGICHVMNIAENNPDMGFLTHTQICLTKSVLVGDSNMPMMTLSGASDWGHCGSNLGNSSGLPDEYWSLFNLYRITVLL